MNARFRCLGAAFALLSLAACATPSTRRTVVASGGTDATTKPGEVVRQYDVNGDGGIDVWKFDTREGDAFRTIRKELDLDGDGRVDVRQHFAPDNTLEREELDLDFDGRIDIVNVYEKGDKVRAEQDLDGNGRVDVWKHFGKGALVRKERDTTGDGKPDLFEYWEGDAIDRIGQDVNGDGVVDRWTSQRVVAPVLPPSGGASAAAK